MLEASAQRHTPGRGRAQETLAAFGGFRVWGLGLGVSRLGAFGKLRAKGFGVWGFKGFLCMPLLLL